MERRTFVRHGAAGLFALSVAPQLIYARNSKRVVCIFQRGGADGLSMVVPHGDPAYYMRRPSIAIPAQSVVDLDGFFGLHPALEPIHSLFVRNRLSIVHAVGTSRPFDSHLAAQKFVEQAASGCGHDVEFIDICGWDTHAAQGSTGGDLAMRLHTLATTIRDRADDDVVIVTMSEFGRSVAENDAGGTDHGHATCMIVCGGATGGKVLGEWPGLGGRDLRATTDVREVFARLI